MTQDLLETIADGVAVLTLNRPERLNAMSAAMLDGLLEALPRLAERRRRRRGRADGSGPRLLRGRRRQGHGGGHRDARHDARGARARPARAHGGVALAPRDAEAHHRHGARARRRARACRSPSPATSAWRGRARGSATAFARVGYSGDFGGSYFLTRLVGTAKARELYYTADMRRRAAGARPRARQPRGPRRAARGGDHGPRRADRARARAWRCRYMKRNMNAAEGGTLKDLLDLEAWHHTRTGMTEDHREAARAFVEKREPTFKGK